MNTWTLGNQQGILVDGSTVLNDILTGSESLTWNVACYWKKRYWNSYNDYGLNCEYHFDISTSSCSDMVWIISVLQSNVKFQRK